MCFVPAESDVEAARSIQKLCFLQSAKSAVAPLSDREQAFLVKKIRITNSDLTGKLRQIWMNGASKDGKIEFMALLASYSLTQPALITKSPLAGRPIGLRRPYSFESLVLFLGDMDDGNVLVMLSDWNSSAAMVLRNLFKNLLSF